MNNYFLLYLISRLDAIHVVCGVVGFIAAIVLVFYYLIYFGVGIHDDEYKPLFGKYAKASGIILITCLSIILFTPSTKDAIIIYAGGKTMNYVESDTTLQKLPQQTTIFISEYLDNAVNEIKEKK